MMSTLLEVRHGSLSFTMPDGSQLPVLRDIQLSIGEHECVGLIGESGCGKSTLARLLLGLYHPDSGDILWQGSRGGMHMIFQDSDGALDPRMTARQILREACHLAGRSLPNGKEQDVFVDLMEQTGLRS